MSIESNQRIALYLECIEAASKKEIEEIQSKLLVFQFLAEVNRFPVDDLREELTPIVVMHEAVLEEISHLKNNEECVTKEFGLSAHGTAG